MDPSQDGLHHGLHHETSTTWWSKSGHHPGEILNIFAVQQIISWAGREDVEGA